MNQAIQNYLIENSIDPQLVEEKGEIDKNKTFVGEKFTSELDEVLSKTYFKIYGLNVIGDEAVSEDISQMSGQKIVRADGTYSKTRLETPAKWYAKEYDYILVIENEEDILSKEVKQSYRIYGKG